MSDAIIKINMTCRICANFFKNSSALVPLYLIKGSNENLPITIIERYNLNDILQICENDHLPQQVCHDCLKKFNVINKFITKALDAQDRLQKYFDSEDLTENLNEVQWEYASIEEDNEEKYETKSNPSDESSDFAQTNCEISHSNINNNFSEDFRFLCHLCNIELETSGKLDRHLTKDHNIRAGDNILCEHCGENFPRKSYVRHLGSVDKSYFCKYCSEKFTSRRNLCEHYNLKHPNEQNNKSEILYSCSKCKRNFKTIVHLQKHQIIGHNPKREQNPRYKPNTCTYCGRIYGRSDHLQIHIKREHLRQLDYKCNYCGKSYVQRFQLNHHIKRSHSAKQIYECEHCAKTYINFKRFKEHISEHSSEPTFECILCGSLFQKIQELKKHEEYHNNESERCLKLEIDIGYENSISEEVFGIS